MVFKLDVHLEGLAERQPAVQSLKAGQQLQLRREDDGTLACVTSDGGVVGVVPAAHMPQLNTAAHFSGAVRSLKRRPGESEVVELLARFTAGQPPPRPSGHAPREDQVDEDVARLSQDQLQQLADNEDVRRYLRDERLQAVVAGIDGAPNREGAVAAALRGPHFKEFADAVLGVVAPQALEGGDT